MITPLAETEAIPEITQLSTENFERWNTALKSKNSEKVVMLYTETAVLLPTFSSEFIIGRSGIRKYFENFLEEHPFGRIIIDQGRVTSPTTFWNAGHYNFHLKEGKVVHARFTLSWINVGGIWLIDHHHSSELPKKIH